MINRLKYLSLVYLSLVALFTLLVAGCGGGDGHRNSSAPPVEQPPGALDPGGSGAPLEQVPDSEGNPVSVVFSNALDINDLNEVVGFAATTAGGNFTAALWAVNAEGQATVTPTTLAPLAGAGNTFSAAFAVDGEGNAAGQSAKGAQTVAVVWRKDADGPAELPPLGAGNSAAFGISPDGSKIVGEAFDVTTGTTRAVLWRVNADGSIDPPQVLPTNIFIKVTNNGNIPVAFSSASGVSNAGLVVGEVEDGEGVLHAAAWEPGAGTAFTPVDLRRGGEEGSTAFAVNAAGQVVGESEQGGVFVPALWAKDAGGEYKRTNIAAAGSASDISAAGRIAGFETSGVTDSATVWDAANPASKTTLYTTESQAYAINGNNLVVGRNGATGFIKKIN